MSRETSGTPERPHGSVRAELRAFAAAFTFMTRIPLGRWITHDLTDLPRSAVWFPLVGAVVGATGAAGLLLAQRWWSPFVAALLATMITVRLTGAFHEDALADAFDGFGGGWSVEQVLAIMKDSRVGSYALVGMILVVIMKCALLADLATTPIASGRPWHGLPLVASALVSAHVLGRCSSIWLMAALPYVRPPSSTERSSAGKPFVDGVGIGRVTTATIQTVFLVFLCLGAIAWIPLLIALLLTTVSGRYFRQRIGGITGDTLGAVNQLVELGVYLILAAAPIRGLFTP
ncbi:adenosylcobinamide-GDP ribazoletransferase [Gemmatimonas aurantiaca]|uniref:adenosylcobinamide-GDP ribazoletransferase n=1 Tax=Gemmatimonas aurantiaca TaxID=173480 RepID=UPI00301DA79B